MAYTVTCVEDEAAFLALEPAWNELGERAPHATIFTTFDWTRVCWDERPAHARPFVLLVHHDDVLVGLLPLRRVAAPLRPVVLQHMGMGFADRCLADYLDVLAADGHENAVVSQIWAFLRRNAARWDALDWWQMPQQTMALDAVATVDQHAPLRMLTQEQSVCHTIALPPTREEFLALLSSNTRSTVERKARKMQRELGAEFVRAETPADVGMALDALFRFQHARWSITDTTRHSAFMDFSRRMALRMLERGALDMRVLRVGDEIAAVNWCFRHNHVTYFYLSAFDQGERWNVYSIGTILLMECIKQAIDAGCHTFDMMRGDYAYKTRFATTAHTNYRVRVTHAAHMRLYVQGGDALRDARATARRQAKAALEAWRRRRAQRTAPSGETASGETASGETFAANEQRSAAAH